MNAQSVFPSLLVGALLGSLGLASQAVPAADNPPPAPMAAAMLQWAESHRHPDLAAAIEYNLAHVGLLSPDPARRRDAEARLTRLGDEFTVAWLRPRDGGPPAAVPAEVAARLVDRISRRLARPGPGAGAARRATIRDWLLRGAVADVTCNAIESPLNHWAHTWSREHAGEPAARAGLESLARPGSRAGTPSTGSELAVAALDRAQGTARALLEAK